MPDRLEVANVTCAASVPVTAPVEVPLGFDGGRVRRIGIVIPAGHAGLTGIALGFAHQPILPFGSSDFLSGDDDVLHFEYNDHTPGVAWSAFVCNLDLQPHSWQVRVELDDTWPDLLAVVTVPIPASDIVAAGDQQLAGA